MDATGILKIGFYVFLTVAVIFFILAVVFFFAFRIPGILSSRKAKVKDNAVAEMAEPINTIGNMPQANPVPGVIERPEQQPVAVGRGAVQPPSQTGASTPEQMNITKEIIKPVERPDQVAVPVAEEDELTTQRFGDLDEAAVVPSATIPAADGVRFDITKKMILCDTQEIIE